MSDKLLKVLHETAQGLHEAGAMDAVTLREFDALCLPPVKTYSAAQIRRLRQRSKASQAVFAACLNTSTSTVQKWEQGQKHPNGPSLKLLNLVDRKGLEALF
ncbi:transcriptional regulator [Burkholderia stagnalis]|uniref:helix-turn-helix domain-containing protein n=1 Tax=Burkholderia stagnalis TaxID=1503054 RepID=UPI000F5DF7C2|nr:DNA-binding transcriptional regulator [Burkholderia stagnalis]RQY09174.1 transcriptional regulator [Burkholderia stagnalis]RQY68678.1 transcriptional regulator [Burkholderia stagnalis]